MEIKNEVKLNNEMALEIEIEEIMTPRIMTPRRIDFSNECKCDKNECKCDENDNNSNNDSIDNNSHDSCCCSICFNEFELNNNKCTTICGHSFHTNCLLQNGQYRNECPMCRHLLIENNDTRSLSEFSGDEDDEEDEDEDYDDEEEEEDDDEEEDAYVIGNYLVDSNHNYWMPARCLWNNLLRLEPDAHNINLRHNLEYGPSRFDSNYCRAKYNIRYGVLNALGHLTDEEWILAENNILQTIMKSYGKQEDVWDNDETIGLSNTNLFQI